jgi:hypothetical protein
MIIVTANVGLLPFEIGKTRRLNLLKACSNARYALVEAKRFPKWANYDTPNTATRSHDAVIRVYDRGQRGSDARARGQFQGVVNAGLANVQPFNAYSVDGARNGLQDAI